MTTETSVGIVLYVDRHASQSMWFCFWTWLCAICVISENVGSRSSISELNKAKFLVNLFDFVTTWDSTFWTWEQLTCFISFGRLDYYIQIQLCYYEQHIWTFTILFTLHFFMLFINNTGIHLSLPSTNITYLFTTSVEIDILIPAQYHYIHVAFYHTATLFQIFYSYLV